MHALRLAALSLALAAAAPVGAAPFTVGAAYEVGDRNGNAFTPGPGDGLYVNRSIAVNVGGSTVTHAVSAGLFVLDVRPDGGGGAWAQFEAFCIQPDVFLTPFSNPYTAVGFAAPAFAAPALISELWGRYRSTIDTDAEAAAFQVALWELAYRTTDRDLRTGDFRLLSSGPDPLLALAQGWIDSLDGTGPRAADLLVLVSDPTKADRQDLLTAGRVPVPASMGLVALGLVGLLALRRHERG